MAKRGLAVLGGVLLVSVAILSALWWVLRASLPLLDGERVVATTMGEAGFSLQSEVRLQRDASGHPSVQAETWTDLAFGLGFLHAQDRFFQMDLSRRLAAGELAALVGEQALPQDQQTRRFRLRRVAREVIADATAEERAWVEAYTRGVNEGLAALGSRPWEYHLLRQQPQPWQAEDSVLVIHAMWWQLQSQGLKDELPRRRLEARLRELQQAPAVIDAVAAKSLMTLLYPRGNEWDTPNFQTQAEAQVQSAELALPTTDSLDLRRLAQTIDASRSVTQTGFRSPSLSRKLSFDLEYDESAKPGSNAWAVAGAQAAAGGAALVAGDMHLGLRIPTVWYPARLQRGRGDSRLELNGVTLPGLPAVAAGSNGHVAWSFTNSYGDWLDLRGYACDATGYDAADGRRDFDLSQETIAVAGAEPVVDVIRYSADGVVIAEEVQADGSNLCWLARWLITEPGATNLRSLALQQVTSLDEAIALAPTVGIPHQNFIVGDRAGRIAWTIIGRIPQDPRGPEAPSPVVWREASMAPSIVDPEVGRLWSANSRHVEGEFERVLGNDEAAGGMFYDTGVRARQIRDRLLALESPATTDDMLSIQLEDRALLLERWQQLLLATLDEDAIAAQPRRADYRTEIENWGGRAAADSVGYRIVRAFRLETRRATWNMLLNSLGVEPGDPPALFEGSLWQLLREQPAHFLVDPGSDNWREFLLQRIDAVIAALDEQCTSLADCRWGDYNATRIRHPLSAALGPLSVWLDYPARPQHGDINVPRVTGPTFGASERFAVAPGREAEGFLHLPGGPSGHPLSPFYRGGFEQWVTGERLPLLPGETRHTLRLLPDSARAE